MDKVLLKPAYKRLEAATPGQGLASEECGKRLRESRGSLEFNQTGQE